MSTSKKNQGEPVFVAPVGVQAYSFRNYFPEEDESSAVMEQVPQSIAYLKSLKY